MKVSRRNLWRLLVASALLLLVLSVAGCGDSGSEEDTASAQSTVSKAEYIRQAEEICNKVQVQQVRLFQQLEQEKAAGNLELQAVVIPLKSEVEELEALPPPQTGADEIQAQAIIDGLDAAIAKYEEEPNSLREGRNPFAEVESKAKAFGFVQCAVA